MNKKRDTETFVVGVKMVKPHKYTAYMWFHRDGDKTQYAFNTGYEFIPKVLFDAVKNLHCKGAYR